MEDSEKKKEIILVVRVACGIRASQGLDIVAKNYSLAMLPAKG